MSCFSTVTHVLSSSQGARSLPISDCILTVKDTALLAPALTRSGRPVLQSKGRSRQLRSYCPLARVHRSAPRLPLTPPDEFPGQLQKHASQNAAELPPLLNEAARPGATVHRPAQSRQGEKGA